MRRKQYLASALGMQKENWGGGGITIYFSEVIIYAVGAISCYREKVL